MRDAQHVRNIGGSRIDPALDSLLAGDLVHDDAQKIRGAFAFGGNLGTDLICIEPGNREGFAGEPFFNGVLAINGNRQVTVDRFEHVEYIHLGVECRKSSGGEQQMIKKAGTRPRTAHDKNRGSGGSTGIRVPALGSRCKCVR